MKHKRNNPRMHRKAQKATTTVPLTWCMVWDNMHFCQLNTKKEVKKVQQCKNSAQTRHNIFFAHYKMNLRLR